MANSAHPKYFYTKNMIKQWGPIRALFFVLISCWGMQLRAQSPFFDYCREGKIEAATSWIATHPEAINQVSESGFSPLILAVYRGQDALVDWLIHNGADLNYVSPEGTALMGAVYKGQQRLIQHLLTKGANPNLSNALGQTALMLAAQTEQPEVMQRLIEAGAQPEQQNAAGKTAADFARISNCMPCLQVLEKKR